jgi:protein-disulfide isomerase
MTLRPLTALCAAIIALAAPGAAQQNPDAPRSAFKGVDPQGNWSAAVAPTERGHLLGNPEAESRLIEFVSYTCSHCASFAMEGDPAIDLTLLIRGRMAVEVRPVIRNAWLAKFQNAPQSQQAIWARADKASRMNAASGLGLADMLVQRGQSISEVNGCVMNDAAAQKIIDNDTADRLEFNIEGTPSFALDGKLLTDVHNWTALYPVLSARFAEGPVGMSPTP